MGLHKFVNIYLKSGEVKKCGSMSSERLDIGFSGAYMTVARGNTCHFKHLLGEVERIVFINDHEGPDLSITVSMLSLDERAKEVAKDENQIRGQRE